MSFVRLQSGVVFTTTLFVSSVVAAADSRTHDSPVAVKGDTFVMGTHAEGIPDLKDRFGVDFPGIFENETPAHEVTVGDYRIDRHQVTNSQFAEFVTANPGWRRANLAADYHNGHYLEHWQETGPAADRADHPVVFITWASAQAYCNWRGAGCRQKPSGSLLQGQAMIGSFHGGTGCRRRNW